MRCSLVLTTILMLSWAVGPATANPPQDVSASPSHELASAPAAVAPGPLPAAPGDVINSVAHVGAAAGGITIDSSNNIYVVDLTAGTTHIYDLNLANTGSIVAIQTGDLGRAVLDGFEVIGRDPGAEARGCSIAADELLGRDSR